MWRETMTMETIKEKTLCTRAKGSHFLHQTMTEKSLDNSLANILKFSPSETS